MGIGPIAFFYIGLIEVIMEITITSIIELSLGLENKAVQLYSKMEQAAQTESLAKLWHNMAAQEKTHIAFWQSLLDLSREQKLWNIFDDPRAVEKELKQITVTVDEYLAGLHSLSDVNASFFAAYKLEIIMLHPAFAAMFILMKEHVGETPAQAYEAHIGTLLAGLEEQGRLTPEFRLIDDLAKRLWKRNMELALKLAEINTLHGVVPICMHCKKIRDDDGYWNAVEKYLKTGMPEDAMLSHGICPQCMEKYYSEYMD